MLARQRKDLLDAKNSIPISTGGHLRVNEWCECWQPESLNNEHFNTAIIYDDILFMVNSLDLDFRGEEKQTPTIVTAHDIELPDGKTYILEWTHSKDCDNLGSISITQTAENDDDCDLEAYDFEEVIR